MLQEVPMRLIVGTGQLRNIFIFIVFTLFFYNLDLNLVLEM